MTPDLKAKLAAATRQPETMIDRLRGEAAHFAPQRSGEFGRFLNSVADQIADLTRKLAVATEGIAKFERNATYPISTDLDLKGFGWRPVENLDYALGELRTALAAIREPGDAE